MAMTLVARPTQRIIASYHIPMFIMLYPLRSRSWRQCMAPAVSTKLGPNDCNSTDRSSPKYPSPIICCSRLSTLKVRGDGTIWVTRPGRRREAFSISRAS